MYYPWELNNNDRFTDTILSLISLSNASKYYYSYYDHPLCRVTRYRTAIGVTGRYRFDETVQNPCPRRNDDSKLRDSRCQHSTVVIINGSFMGTTKYYRQDRFRQA